MDKKIRHPSAEQSRMCPIKQECKNNHGKNRKQAGISLFTMMDLYQLSNRDYHCEIDAKSKEEKSKAKLDETIAKINKTYFHSGGEISRK
jgi:hypothetical protein